MGGDLVTGRALRLPSTISVTLAPAGSRRLDVPPRLPALDGQPAAGPGAAADGLTCTVSIADSPSPSVTRQLEVYPVAVVERAAVRHVLALGATVKVACDAARR